MEEKINLVYDNLIEKLRSDFPNIKDDEVKLYIYSVIGFPASFISLLLKESKVEKIYNKKRHLKDKLRYTDKVLAVDYIKFMT